MKETFNLYTDSVCIHPSTGQANDCSPSKTLACSADGQAAQRMPGWRVNLTGALELGTRAALVSQARLLVSNDTEISRMAVALKTPSG